VRQRNDGDAPLIVHTEPPQTVEPGTEISHDVPVIGLTVLDAPVDLDPDTNEASSEAVPAPPAVKKTKETTR
jgi:hypothetical protein